jgi:periplasmic copper chaperone A
MRLTLLLLAALAWGCAPDADAPAPSPAEQAPAAQAEAPAQPAAEAAVVSEAWVRAVPPTARMTAGYLKLHNPGPDELVVVGAESPLFGSVEMHGTEIVDGVARMRHQERLSVPAGETVSFEPGGLHLMLMQAVDSIPEGGTIELSLLLEDGARLDFEAQVGQPGS